MHRRIVVPGLLVMGLVAGGRAYAADPAPPLNPFKLFVRSPFSAEAEVYAGGITGKSVGAAFHSATRGDYGVRFTFGFLKALNFGLNYMYSNQTRSFTAVTPPAFALPQGTALVRAANLNMFFGDGEWNVIKSRSATFYVSPGVGFIRNGARSMTIITPLGAASSPILPGTAVTFNLGVGTKIFPVRHWGLRFDVRDHISGGGTGTLNPNQNLVVSGTTFSNPARFFGPIPVQNNIVFTLGLIFKIL